MTNLSKFRAILDLKKTSKNLEASVAQDFLVLNAAAVIIRELLRCLAIVSNPGFSGTMEKLSDSSPESEFRWQSSLMSFDNKFGLLIQVSSGTPLSLSLKQTSYTAIHNYCVTK